MDKTEIKGSPPKKLRSEKEESKTHTLRDKTGKRKRERDRKVARCDREKEETFRKVKIRKP